MCDEYDPRIRPWYTIAASGSKNVLILIDKSSSMRLKSSDIKTVANTMIDTLSISDNVGVISFTNDTEIIGKNKVTLIQATSSNKAKLKSEVSKL